MSADLGSPGVAGLLVDLSTLIAVKASILIVLAIVATRILRSRSAATRSACWTALGVALVALPAVMAVIPRVDVTLPGTRRVSEWFGPMDESSHRVSRPSVAEISVSPSSPRVDLPPPIAPRRDSGLGRPLRWLPAALILIWASGVALLASGFLVSCVRLRRIRGRAKRADESLTTDVLACAREIGVRRRVRVERSREIVVPLTGGLFRPCIILPADYQGWDSARRRAVLVHELAHIARWDYAGHVLFEVVRALYWPNPLAWHALTRATAERELAADDRVILAGTSPGTYAAELLAFARSAVSAAAPRAVVSIAPSALKARIRAILRGDVDRSVPTRRAVGAIVATAAVGLPLIASLSSTAGGGVRARGVPLSLVARSISQQPAPQSGHHEANAPSVGVPHTDSLLAVLFFEQGRERRVAAARALRSSGADSVVSVLVSAFSDRCHADRYRAARALRELRDERAIPALVRELVSDDHRAVRAMAANAIAASGPTEGAILLRSAMVGAPGASFERVARAIDTLGETVAHTRLLDALRQARRSRPAA
jgi:beta-lactamase regulating signal transducer with metallopeptidase domain